MTQYLQTPCPRCSNKKLTTPYKSGKKVFSKCDFCGKNAGVKQNANGTFEIYIIGRRGARLIHRKVSLPSFCEGMTPDEIRRLVEIGKSVLDKRLAF